MVPCNQYDVGDLEAVWADVKVGNIRTLIGSVYVNVGKLKDLELLDKALDKILKDHKRVLICMDANARNSLWDSNCAGIRPYSKSKKMGDKLVEIINKHGLFVHNSGESTFQYEDKVSALDVTLSVGLCNNYPHKWNVLDDELRTPHSAVLVEFGDSLQDVRRSVTDWNKFDWSKYEEKSKGVLTGLLESWRNSDVSIDVMSDGLVSSLVELAESIGTKKVVSRHSRPWVDNELSSMMEELRNLRRKYQRHRSETNKRSYEEKREQVENYLDKVKEVYKVEQCKRIAEARSDKERWQIINRLTNSEVRMSVQPIRRTVNGKEEYAFEDKEIIEEMETYHICKEGSCGQGDLSEYIESEKDADTEYTVPRN